MLKVLIGDMFKTECNTLVNTVNCVGIMGKGIAAIFKEKYPSMYKDYVMLCKEDQIKPGQPYYYCDLLGASVINFPTKDHWRASSRIEYIIKGLDWFGKNYQEMNIQSIAFPPLGCGNGGLRWEDIGPVMYQYLSKLPIDIEIYAPFGTSHKYLTKEYLQNGNGKNNSFKQSNLKMRKEWIALLDIIRILDNNPFSLYVGRTAFQKICYVITELGIETGFIFRQGQYGPYSENAKQAITIFANNNLIVEEKLGKMIRLKVASECLSLLKDYDSIIDEYKQQIDKTVNLFSRIKNTNQAEVMITVFYAVKQLENRQNSIDEKQIYDYVIGWKRKWDNTEKSKEISSSIRNLIALGYIKASYNSKLPYIAEC